ncbi:MAG: SLBB domain-containing protein [Bdellovibrionaceae bacterium]|nr:SLBB domain-containing protein [Pseudobdellovibrionaceae bacterium]
MKKRFLTLWLIFNLFSPQYIYAQSGLPQYSLTDEAFRTRLSEYFYNQNNVDVLVPVRLMGNVNKPGLYHVPSQTSMLTLLSISGGPGKNADLDNIKVSSMDGKQNKLSLSQLINTENHFIVQQGDVVYIPDKHVTFDQNTLNAFTVITGIVSLLLTAVLVSEQLKN